MNQMEIETLNELNSHAKKTVKSSSMNYNTESEKKEIDALVQQWKRAEPNAIERDILGNAIIHRYEDKIKHYVAYILIHQGGKNSPYYEDAYQEALVVFYKMLESYDPSKNNNPYFYAKQRIKQKVYSYVNCYIYECNPWVAQNSVKMNQIMQENPSLCPKEVSEKMDMSIRCAMEYIEAIQPNISFEQNESAARAICDPTMNVNDNILYEINHVQLFQLLDQTLEAEEKEILFLYYGILGEKKTATEISKEFGYTASNVRLLVQKAITKIQNSKPIMELLSSNCR